MQILFHLQLSLKFHKVVRFCFLNCCDMFLPILKLRDWFLLQINCYVVLQLLNIFVSWLKFFLSLTQKGLKLSYCQFLVYFGCVFDLFGTYTKTQSRNRLGKVADVWRGRDDQGCFGVTSQRLLKNSGQFAVSVRNMRWFSISQCVNYLSQSTQRSVDLLGLIKHLTLCSSLRNTPWACQIHQVKLTSLGSQIDDVVLTDTQDEQHMRARWTLVHISGSYWTSGSGGFDELVNLLHRRDIVFS